MFDSIAISFVAISLMSQGKLRRSFWSGLAVFAKSIPIIYAAPMVLNKPARRKDAFALILTVAIPVVLSVATILVMRWPISIVGATIGSTVGKEGGSMSIWDALFYFNYLGLPTPPAQISGALGYAWIPALIVLTLVALSRFRVETDHGLVQALLVCTFAFLIFKAQITEQYALYFFWLAVIDNALWHPERKRILVAAVTVAMIYLVVNNYFLLRFLSPVYPGFINFEQTMYKQISPARYAINFAAGTAFTLLNLKYLLAVLRRPKQFNSA